MAAINTAYLPASFFDANGKLKVPEAEALEVAKGIQAKADAMPEAEKMIFLALLKSDIMAPVNDKLPEDLDETIARFEAASARLAAATDVGNFLEELARLIVEQMGLERQDAVASRMMARNQAMSELENQATQMEKSASDMRTGAIINLVLSVVSAAVSVIMSAVSAVKATSAAKGLKDAGDLSDEAAQTNKIASHAGPKSAQYLTSEGRHLEFKANLQLNDTNQLVTKAQNIGNVGQSLNQLGQAGANFGSAEMQAQAKEEDADAQRYAASAEFEKGRADTWKEFANGLQELATAIREMLKQIQEGETQRMAAHTKV